MTGRTAFTDEEWELLRDAPTGAGLVVSTAHRGGTFREAVSMGRAYADARGQHGESELLDELVSARPEVDRPRVESVDKVKQISLQRLRDAIALLEQKATPEEVDDFRGFVLGLAERVASAKEEDDARPASEAEQAAIAEIRDALGAAA